MSSYKGWAAKMGDVDYKKLGFKAGLEIHQQLETNKLFCDCPSLVNDTNPVDINFVRKLRPVAGETGEVDIAAKHEMEKNKEIIYEACSTSSCLVEHDCEPPHPINKEALDIALEVALLLNAKIVDEVQVMRKTVVDGSNTSGFQRTALIATDGYIDTSKGRVNIPLICLEEEAAKKIKETKDSVTYRLDRLGIPLVEIGTDADIKDAEHAKEVASILGMVLRSTGKVKRGIGSIRQDVNVSIKNGARTEIKGFQDLKSIPKVIENEVKRQLDLIKQGKKLKQEVRKSEQDFTTSFLRPMPGSARMYPETDVAPINITKEKVAGIKLPELISEKAKNLEQKYKLRKDVAEELIKRKIDFEDYVSQFKNIEPSFIAHTLVNIPKEIKKRFDLDSEKLKEEDFKEILSHLDKNKISKEAVIELLVGKIKGKKVDISKYKGVSEDNLENEIKKIVEAKPALSVGAYMGIIMAKYRGKVDGQKVMQILKKLV